MRPFSRATLPLALLAALGLTACPPPEPECDPELDDCFDGGVVDDPCNTPAEALVNPECVLTAGTAREAFIGPPVEGQDRDWYLMTMPATLTARSLLHVTAAYGAMNTPVNLAVAVYDSAGTKSFAREVDAHLQAAPKPVDIILPFNQPGAKTLLLVSDEGTTAQIKFDARNPYSVKWETMENPDSNEPNDAADGGTVIPLAGTPPTGTVMGAALATDNDVDQYLFAAPTGRKIIYVHVTAPVDSTKPPPYRLSFTLFDPAGTPVAEASVPNNYRPVDLATAKLASGMTGNYRLEVKAYRPANDTSVIPGDLNLKYAVNVQILDDLDPSEGPTGNDTRAAADARAAPLTPGQSVSPTGRLSYVPDPEWFAFDISGALPAVLRVKATAMGGAASRFASPVTDVPDRPLDRQLRIFKSITTGPATDRATLCKRDPVACPKGYGNSTQQAGLVDAFCDTGDGAMCLYAERNEFVEFANMSNFEARVPITQPGRYYVLFQDDGTNYADDKEWQLTIALDGDSDDQSRAGLPAQTQVSPVPSGSWPAPSGGQVSGVLTHGYGYLRDNDPNRGEGIRAPTDYDAVISDSDRFEFTFPSGTTGDRHWSVEWDVVRDGGPAPGVVDLQIELCDSLRTAADGGSCRVVNTALGYAPGRLQPWYSGAFTDRTELWTRAETPFLDTTAATANACLCFQPRFTAAGRYFVKVIAVDRQSHEPIYYRLRQNVASYPQTYSHPDGGASTSCPPETVPDAGGCRLCNVDTSDDVCR